MLTRRNVHSKQVEKYIYNFDRKGAAEKRRLQYPAGMKQLVKFRFNHDIKIIRELQDGTQVEKKGADNPQTESGISR